MNNDNLTERVEEFLSAWRVMPEMPTNGLAGLFVLVVADWKRRGEALDECTTPCSGQHPAIARAALAALDAGREAE